MPRALLPAVLALLAAVPGTALAAFGTPQEVSTAANTVAIPRLAVGPSGAAVLAFKDPSAHVLGAIRGSGAFGTATNLSSAAVSTPRVAMDDTRQQAAVAWVRSGALEVALREPDGATLPPITVATGVDQQAPDVAFDPQGTLTVVFLDGGLVHIAQRPANGSFGTPTAISEGPATAPRVAALQGGGAVVAWRRIVGTNEAVESRTKFPFGSSFDPVFTHESTNQAVLSGPDIDANLNGSTALVWNRNGAGIRLVGRAGAGGEWTAPATLDGGGNVSTASVVVDGSQGDGDFGRWLATWAERGFGQADPWSVKARTGTLGNAAMVQATQTLRTTTNAVAPAPAPAMNDDGAAVVALNAAGTIEAVKRAAGGTFGTPAPLSAAGADEPFAGIDAAGDATVGWTRGATVEVASESGGGGGTPGDEALVLREPADGVARQGLPTTASGCRTNGGAVTLELRDAANAVRATATGTPASEATCPGGLGWTATLPAPTGQVQEGQWSVTATQDTATDASSFRYDLTPPKLNPRSVGGPTKEAPKVRFEGCGGIAAGDATQIQIRLFDRKGTTGTPILTTARGMTPDPSGCGTNAQAWLFELEAADGWYTVEASQTDDAGHRSVITIEKRLDRTAPAVSVTSPAYDAAVGTIRPAFKGRFDRTEGDGPSVNVRVLKWNGSDWLPETETVQAPVAGDGTWSYDLAEILRTSPRRNGLRNGTYDLEVWAFDDLSQRGEVRHRFRVEDKQGPKPTVTEPKYDAVVRAGRPTLSGAIGTEPGDLDEIEVKVWRFTGSTWVPHASSLAARSGDRWTTTAFDLPDGTYDVEALQTDVNGNTGSSGRVRLNVRTPPPNQAPTIAIRKPNDGQRFRVGDAVTASVACSDAEDGAPAVCTGNAQHLDTSRIGEHVFTATARDSGGLETTATRRYFVDPQPADVGIRIQGIELMQAVQTPDVEAATGTARRAGLPFTLNAADYAGVLLVSKKSAIARVYVEARRDANIALHGFRNGKRFDTLMPTLPANGNLLLDDTGTRQKQGNPFGAVAFRIPADWIASGLELVATVVPSTTPSADACSDCTANNGFLLKDIDISASRGWHFGMVEFRRATSPKKSPDGIDWHLDRVVPLLPVPDGKVTFDSIYRAVLTVPGDHKDGSKEQNGALVDALYKWDQEQKDGGNDSDFTLGVAPKKTDAGIQTGGPIFTPKSCSGFIIQHCTYGRPVAVTVADRRWFTGTGHEIGHGLGRPHASKCNGGGKDGQPAESWAPDQKGYLQGIAMDGEELAAGRYRILDGTSTQGDKADYDFMSYCADVSGGDENSWISPHNWNEVFARLRANKSFRPASAGPRAFKQASGPTLAVRGHVTASGVVIDSVAPGTAGNGAPGAEVQVAARNAAGQTVATVPMSVTRTHVDTGDAVVLLAGTVPAAGIDSLAITANGADVATVKRSPGVPEVQLTSPRTGAAVGGGRTVRVAWKASDADGGALSAELELSADGGRTWRTVFEGAASGATDLPSAMFSASRDARLRVTVSDGWNTASDTSGRFRTQGAPPAVRIFTPTGTARVGADGVLPVAGSGTDDRGKPLAASRLRWVVGKRTIARGPSASVEGLRPGRHVLRLIGTDRLGRTASDTVKIRVVPVRPVLTTVRLPPRVGARRTVVVRVAANVAATLRIGKQRFAVDRRVRALRVRVPAVRGGRATFVFRLASGGRTSRSQAVVRR
jgi:hypothetical protein